MKKILVTGASGFIGSFLVEEALSRDWQTWAGIRGSSSREYLQDSRILFVDLNYANKENLKKQLQEHKLKFGSWDYIIHNAGVTKCLDSKDFDRVNYEFTKNLIEALIETDSVPDKFILMSSLSAHAENKTIYGESKLKAEGFLKKQTNFPFIILCPTGVYGPREKDYFLMLKTIKSGLDVSAGFETQHLTFIYVKDLVKAVFLALTSDETNKTYFVAEGTSYTDSEYTTMVKKLLNKKFVLKLRIPLPIVKLVSCVAEDISKITKKPSTLNRDKYKIMAQRDWRCNIEPIQNDLGFNADYDLNRGMQESLNWYKENKWI